MSVWLEPEGCNDCCAMRVGVVHVLAWLVPTLPVATSEHYGQRKGTSLCENPACLGLGSD